MASTNIAGNLRKIFAAMMENVATATVGEIVSYDSGTRRAKIQPLIMRHYKGDAEPTLLPILQNVMILDTGTKAATLHVPPKPGDGCLVIFVDRSISNWKGGDGSAKAAKDVRMHSDMDGVAVLVRFDQNTDAVTGPDDVVLGHDDGEIRIKEGGGIEIGKGKGNKAAARKGDSTLADDDTDSGYFAWLAGLAAILENWVVVPADGGGALRTAIGIFLQASPTPTEIAGKISTGSSSVKVGD